MISTGEAKNIIRSVILPDRIATLPLQETLGMVVACDIYATCDIPGFAQSSMDGYAIRFDENIKEFTITGTIPAGTTEMYQLLNGQAMRIFTGAPLPEGADTVIMQEKVLVENGILYLNNENPEAGQHVRLKGAEVKKGETAMAAGTILSPAAIGFLAGIGKKEIPVYAPPSVTILLTGDELCAPGQSLLFGQVYDANSFQLTAALQHAGIRSIQLKRAKDTIESVQKAISVALEETDLLLITGGVSVGDYDLVIPAAKDCGIQTLFHKIKQKPGKPLFFGTKDQKIVYGLPGNPSSALTCFYEYVLPLIDTWMKAPDSVKKIKAEVKQPYKKTNGLTHFIKAVYSDGKVSILHAQESFRLHSFAQSNCFVVLPEDSMGCKEGEIVDVHLIPA